MEYLKNQILVKIDASFFKRDAQTVAQDLLGKVIQVRKDNYWLTARIIETEAYYLKDKGSHASLGNTESRRALFMPPGTIYMYYARGGDSLNFSCQGEGNAVLIKSAYPLSKNKSNLNSINRMIENNPGRNGQPRSLDKLCAGQTLLCRALGLKVPEWNAKQPDTETFRLVDDSYRPEQVIQTTRLGINSDRDAHLPYRFIDTNYAKFCTKNPLSVRSWQFGKEYTILTP